MIPMNWTNLKEIFPLLAHGVAEGRVFSFADAFSKNYTGGQWMIERLGDFLFVIAPSDTYRVVNSDNYYEGDMDARTFGVALTLLIYNLHLWEHQDRVTEELADRYHAMKDAALDNPSLNTTALIRFLD